MATATLTVPAGMHKVYRLFGRWRSAHTGRLPIPDDLWALAIEAAREHGVFRTAKILRLEHGKLKRMVQSAAPVARPTAPPAFVELMAPPAAGLTECVIELEGSRGKMRIQWKGTVAPDLSGLSRALWESA